MHSISTILHIGFTTQMWNRKTLNLFDVQRDPGCILQSVGQARSYSPNRCITPPHQCIGRLSYHTSTTLSGCKILFFDVSFERMTQFIFRCLGCGCSVADAQRKCVFDVGDVHVFNFGFLPGGFFWLVYFAHGQKIRGASGPYVVPFRCRSMCIISFLLVASTPALGAHPKLSTVHGRPLWIWAPPPPGH